MFRMELKKFCNTMLLVLFAVLLLFKGVSMYHGARQTVYTFDLLIYAEYIECLQALTQEEQETYFINEQTRLEEAIEANDTAQALYDYDEISVEEYIDIHIAGSRALIQTQVLDVLYQRFLYFETIRENGCEPVFFYDTELLGYLNTLSGNEYLLLFFLITSVIHIAALDKECHVDEIVRITRYGNRRIVGVRFGAALLYAVVVSAIMLALEYCIAYVQGVDGLLSERLYSLEQFSVCSYDISVRDYILMVLLVKLLWAAASAAFAFAAAMYIKNRIAALFFCACIVIAPLLFQEAIPAIWQNLIVGVQMTGTAVANSTFPLSVVCAGGIVTVSIFSIALHK